MYVILNIRRVSVSIHAPTRGATRWQFLEGTHLSGFNPRSHEGSDKQGVSQTVEY